ncbi:DUF1643 domain-containing protein [Enterococcus dispar]|uniref:DUF1643 domain-containing protein n=1 Tax=Enterococcus dispar TaxID=44009 RepID=UPI002492F113|nr:DUF1643 domain-containing protein [Enterococcus dispar]
MIVKKGATITIENWLSDNNQHRYLQKRVWGEGKNIAVVVTVHPGTADPVNADLTTLLIQNRVHELGHDGVFLVNLFSSLSVTSKNKRALKQSFDAHSFEVLDSVFSDKSVKAIIFGMGSIVANNQLAAEAFNEVLGKIPQAKSKLVKYLVTDEGKPAHPLFPSVRGEWVLSKELNLDISSDNVKD